MRGGGTKDIIYIVTMNANKRVKDCDGYTVLHAQAHTVTHR